MTESKWAADGPGPNPSSAGGGIMAFSCFGVSDMTCGVDPLCDFKNFI